MRKVTRKIYDFSPEQEKNLLAVVWLYRGHTGKYLNLVAGYCLRTLNEAAHCRARVNETGEAEEPLADYTAALIEPPAVMSASPPRKRMKISTLRKPCEKSTWNWKTSTPEAVTLAAAIKRNFQELGI